MGATSISEFSEEVRTSGVGQRYLGNPRAWAAGEMRLDRGFWVESRRGVWVREKLWKMRGRGGGEDEIRWPSRWPSVHTCDAETSEWAFGCSGGRDDRLTLTQGQDQTGRANRPTPATTTKSMYT